ncbi:MAG: hypothetical protein FWC09_11210 [Lachnospiraceae bacterium]|nr:hypothetical protein [Lachnospiraceae bacterium]
MSRLLESDNERVCASLLELAKIDAETAMGLIKVFLSVTKQKFAMQM